MATIVPMAPGGRTNGLRLDTVVSQVAPTGENLPTGANLPGPGSARA